jgi:hypothetical protein
MNPTKPIDAGSYSNYTADVGFEQMFNFKQLLIFSYLV